MEYKPIPGLSIESRLIVVEEILGRIELRLFGNGQPGELNSIKKRLTDLEQFKWKFVGAMGAALTIAETVKYLAK